MSPTSTTELRAARRGATAHAAWPGAAWRQRRRSVGRGPPARRWGRGFTLLEVLVAMTLLSVTLVTIYQAFASNIYLVRSNRATWKAMVYVNNELMRWERRGKVPVGVSQGGFEADDPTAGYTWKRTIRDDEPIPGVRVRKVELLLEWQDGASEREYRSHIYVAAD